MADFGLIAGLAGAGAQIFGGFAKQQQGNTAYDIANVNAANLRTEGDTTEQIAKFNALVAENDGDVAKASAEFQAMQQERAAAEARQQGSINVAEKETQLNQVLSQQRARAAASGAGGGGTAGVMDIMGDTFQRGKYLESIDTYNAETQARGSLDQAAAARAQGEAARARAYATAYGIDLEGQAARTKAYNAALVAQMQGKAAKTQGTNALIGGILEGIGTGGKAAYNYWGTGAGGYDPNWHTRVNYG